MNTQLWSSPTTNLEAHRRAGGRRSYNLQRQFIADARRFELSKIIAEIGLARGWQTKAAEKLGVSRSTISRDYKKMIVEKHRRANTGSISKATNDLDPTIVLAANVASEILENRGAMSLGSKNRALTKSGKDHLGPPAKVETPKPETEKTRHNQVEQFAEPFEIRRIRRIWNGSFPIQAG